MPREIVRISNFQQGLQKTEIGDLLKFYAIKLDKQIHFRNREEGEAAVQRDYSKDVIQILVDSLPNATERKTLYKTVKVFEKEINFTMVKFLQGPLEEDEKLVTDENRNAIARVLYNTICIPFELIPNRPEALKSSFQLLRYILEKSVALLSFDISKWEAIRQKESLRAYATLLKGNLSRAVKESNDKIEAFHREIQDYNRRLQSAYRKAHEENELIETLRLRNAASFEEQARKGFEKMQKMTERGLYESIDFQKESCVAKTKKCFISYQGKRYDVGRFEISIANDSVEFKNLDYPENSHQHPHIRNSRPCYGNIGSEIAKLAGRKEFLVLLELVHRYLNSYNHNDAYMKVGSREWKWKEVDNNGKTSKKKEVKIV